MKNLWLCGWMLVLSLPGILADSTDDGDDDWDTLAEDNEPRAYDGTGNNIDQPEWGSVGQTQLRSLADPDYADGVSDPPGDDRPTARELLSEVFLAAPSSSSTASALFVGWGLLVGYDLFLTQGNASEPLDIACNDAAILDVWCPQGALSDPIPFNRSQGGVDDDDDAGSGARSPINYATAFVDLDWMYGRDEDAARALRTLTGGYLNLTDDELPHLLDDGTWLVADQRPARFPVTFALMTLLLREHNRCCDEMAPGWDADADDEDTYQLCRQWTIAVFQHITENDFSVRLVGGSIKVMGAAAYDDYPDDDDDGGRRRRRQRRRRRRLGALENVVRSRYLAQTNGSYDVETNAGADVLFSTVAVPAFFSALPPTVGLLGDGFEIIDEHGVELATASADLPGLVSRAGGIEPIIRGAAYARTQVMDVSFAAQVAVSSPLFNLPVEVVQRGRDHGVPLYNDAREAYGLSRLSSFSEVTSDTTVQQLLADAHGNDLELVDAYTGALAESEDGSGLFAGPLLRAVFLEQLYRAIVGDRHHHSHSTENEDAALSTLTDLILDNSAVSSMPLDTFSAPDLVASANCSSAEANEVTLAEGFKLAWDHSELTDDGGNILITLSARGIEGQGMLGIGFGGQTMSTTPDFVICVVSSETSAVCTDHSGPGDRAEPPLDDEDDTELDVLDVSVDGEWTTVTFARSGDGTDSSDYPLSDDIDLSSETPIIYSWRSGEGIGKHPNSQRGAVQVNFQDGSVTDEECSDAEDYYALHGALLLLAWMVVAPYGIYQARYRKGKKSIIGNLWWEMHQECMVVCAEALLPLAITAIFTTAGPHNSSHARWGFYMIGAIVLQIATGFARVRALEAKSNNFSLFHRVNKHFHIYAGWFAYAAGLVQCYRGLELVGGTDKLIFSAVDISFKLGNFKVVQDILFPVWLGVIPPIFFIMEVRKQFKRYFTKGAASVCGVVELINEEFSDAAIQKEVEDRLMPRTEELPIYDMPEFNDKVLNGRSWVILDGAVLDVSSFAKRHPGGARLIINAMGTDVTAEFLGENAASISNSKLTIDAHPHTDTALEIARSLVVGYIEEEDDHEDDDDDDDGGEGKTYTSETEDSRSGDAHGSERRSRSWLSGSDSEGSGADRRASMSSSARRNSRATPPRTFHLAPPRAFTPRGEETTRLGRLASFSRHAENSDVSRSRASVQRRNSISVAGGGGGGNATVGLDDSRSSRATSVDDDRSGAEGRRYSADDRVRRKSFGSSDGSGSESSDNAKRKKFGRRSSSSAAIGASAAAAGKGATVGPAVRLSAEAAAILRAEPSPPAAMKQAEDASTERTSRSMSAPAEQGRKPAPAAAAAGELPVVAPNVGRTVTAGGTAQGAPVSTVGPTGLEVRPRATSLNDTKPLTIGRPVTTRWMEPPPPDWKADGIKAVGARMIKRLGSQIEFRGGTSGDESDTKQDDRPFKMTRKVQKTRNPLEFFHVCPLLLHGKLCDGKGRPVHRLVFACPGKAAAMVAAMKGVCHFNMRLAQEAGMTVVQRAYNAFAVRVLGEEGDFRVVPASETEDGVLSVEMRIRLYPDGLMSNLLSQLIKNLDNPAVQLQGPFLQDRLTPPPAHRNVVMIAAGTGVNPMIQIIRDYLALGSHNNGPTAVPHSRLVLLWQNSVEADIYCADELTTLQARANGLLEVTALVSGDITRRNIPGNAFRRAKARLMKKGAEAGLVSRSGAQQGGGSGAGQDSKQQEEAERALSLTQDMPADGLPRLRLMSELSRVSEEDSNCNTNLGTSKHGVGELDAMEPSDDDLDGRHRLQRSEGARGPFLSCGVSLRSEMATDNVDSRGDASARVSAAGRKGGQGDDPRRGDVERGGAVRDASGGGGGSHKFEIPARSGIRLADSLQAAGLDRGRWKKSDRTEKRSTGRKSRGKGTVSRSRGPGSETVSTDTAASTASDAQQRPKHAAGGKRRGRRVKSRDRSATRGSEPKVDSPLDDSNGGLQHCKLSREILEGACGEPVMAAVAAANAAAEVDLSKNSASRKNDALRELVGTEGVGGKLQVIVSGPAGFVFHVEGLLADLHIPPQVVVTLD